MTSVRTSCGRARWPISAATPTRIASTATRPVSPTPTSIHWRQLRSSASVSSSSSHGGSAASAAGVDTRFTPVTGSEVTPWAIDVVMPDLAKAAREHLT